MTWRQFACRLDSTLLFCALTTLNRAILQDIRAHYHSLDRPYPPEGNPLLGELSKYLEAAGIADPLTTIYITRCVGRSIHGCADTPLAR
jgi:WASH complex subunit strumpellin